MEKLFGLPMNGVMLALLAIFLATMAVVVALALRNRIMLKLGLRPIPRRPGQSTLIVVGVMLSTVIMAAAFGTGDTISYTIRNGALTALAEIDEIIVSLRAGTEDTLGLDPYIPYERFEQLQAELAGNENIDGLVPQLAETVPTVNPRTSLSEGRMRVVGIPPTLLQGFGGFKSTTGKEVRLEQLGPAEAYINDKAAKELDAIPGDELQLFVGDDTVTLKVLDIVDHGGLAGRDPTLLLPLERAQVMFGKPGQINLIAVSNRGDRRTGAELSEEVTEGLRVRFTDREVASRLKALLGQEEVTKALEEREATLTGKAQEEFSEFRAEVAREELSDNLVSFLGDRQIVESILSALEKAELRQRTAAAISLFADLGQFRVFDIKHDSLSQADEAGSVTTTLFITMALFSIGVGVLLIFLIFVMLAAARRSEMGMARAVGAKRGHMVQMFLYEGTAYALIAAAVGVVIGLGVSVLILSIAKRILSGLEVVDFEMFIHFEPRSAIVAYCLGMAITFCTVIFSAYRVSRLNIVMAIRDLPQALMPTEAPPFRERLTGLLRALARPFIFLARAFTSLRRRRFAGSIRNLALAVALVVVFPLWIGDIVAATLRFIWPYFLRGWLTLLVGPLFIWWGISIKRDSPFAAGASLIILGLGLIGRRLLDRTPMRADVRDRVAFTATGVLMLVYWSLPMSLLDPLIGELQGDFDMMFVSGIFMVGAAVWTIMWNADLVVKAVNVVAGRAGKLRPVLVTAVAYPMSSRFRTGLTLAMFALVIFTLVVMSAITESFTTSFSDPETMMGGWDVRGDVNRNTPIEDIRQAVVDAPRLRIEDFQAIGGYTRVWMGARQIDAKNQRWERHALSAADDAFLDAAEFRLKLIADGYGTTLEEVWEALKTQPNLAVVEGQVLGTRADPESDWPPFAIEGPPYYDDESMSPVDIEVREPRTGTIIPLKVIGVVDLIHENFNWGTIVSKSTLDQAIPVPVPINTYTFRLADGVDAAKTAKDIEASFLEHGMEAEGLLEAFEEQFGAFRGFVSILLGFMGLGVVVGIAGLGVVSTRAVVERRQQIGVLRAIGYRRGMVQLSFLLEFSFVALLGTAIGVVLGLILGYQAVTDIRSEEANETLRFSVPWLQIIVIISLTYLFSLLATYLPARQASRIYPAEALRYE